MNLRTPGPTPMPDSVAQALSQPMINHRGPEFAELLLAELEIAIGAFATPVDCLGQPDRQLRHAPRMT